MSKEVSDQSNKPGPGERGCDRINLSRTILVELDNGEILRGYSVDLSPRGALLELEVAPKGRLPGQAGALFIISPKGEFSVSYPCKVVRQTGRSVALKIDKHAAAAFGDYLTRDLLGHPQTD